MGRSLLIGGFTPAATETEREQAVAAAHGSDRVTIKKEA